MTRQRASYWDFGLPACLGENLTILTSFFSARIKKAAAAAIGELFKAQVAIPTGRQKIGTGRDVRQMCARGAPEARQR